MKQTKRPASPYDETYAKYLADVDKYVQEVKDNKRYFTPQDQTQSRFHSEGGPLGTGRFVNPPTDKRWEQGPGPGVLETIQNRFGTPEQLSEIFGGVGPSALGGTLSKVPGAVSKWGMGFRAKPNPIDPGGFHVPTRKMILDDPHLATSEAVRANSNMNPLWENENRADYLFGRNLENQAVTDMRAGDPLKQMAADERYVGMLPNEQRNINKVLGGQRQLSEEVTRGTMSRSGGGVPSDADIRLFTEQDPSKFRFKRY